MISSDDIVVWPCGTWCYGDEKWEMNFLSDDYYVLTHGTTAYFNFLAREEGE